MYNTEHIKTISSHFQIDGHLLLVQPCKIGHINETYTASYGHKKNQVHYVHQKINKSVFKDPVGVMENITRVTEHTRKRLEQENTPDLGRRVLTLIPCHNGRSYYIDDAGEYWRTYVFIENARTFETAKSPDQAFEAGKAFGRFQQLLADLGDPRLNETIPNFHNTRDRFNALIRSTEEDICNRSLSAKEAIDFALQHEPMVDVLINARASGLIPERITHNDTKFNNVMLDDKTGKELCVIDLDTVMPGLALYDFGDMVRTTTSPALEDEKDLSKVVLQIPMFEALTSGYLNTAGKFLTRAELDFLAFSGKLITYTIGIRFLTDYLSGDTYFRIHRPEHNLDRCKTQFQLVSQIEQKEESLQRYVESACTKGEVPACCS